jgi:hypothetical protein
VTLAEPEVDSLARAAAFRRQRQGLQEVQVARLAEMLPLPQIRLPYLFATDLGPDDVVALASTLGEQLASVRTA